MSYHIILLCVSVDYYLISFSLTDSNIGNVELKLCTTNTDSLKSLFEKQHKCKTKQTEAIQRIVNQANKWMQEQIQKKTKCKREQGSSNQIQGKQFTSEKLKASESSWNKKSTKQG